MGDFTSFGAAAVILEPELSLVITLGPGTSRSIFLGHGSVARSSSLSEISWLSGITSGNGESELPT